MTDPTTTSPWSKPSIAQSNNSFSYSRRLKNAQPRNYDVTLMTDQISEVFLSASVNRMQLSENDINRCLDKLSEEQLWHRGGDHENSIANLLLHLEGNLRQWFLHGISGQPDVRVRDEEFTLSPSQPCDEVRSCFSATLAECRKVIASLPPERLLEKIDPQPGGNWGPMTILEAIYRIVGHLQLHQGQIILLAKQLTGSDLDLSLPRKR
jgi:uncharacterized damage-inducible protein DinB